MTRRDRDRDFHAGGSSLVLPQCDVTVTAWPGPILVVSYYWYAGSGAAGRGGRHIQLEFPSPSAGKPDHCDPAVPVGLQGHTAHGRVARESLAVARSKRPQAGAAGGRRPQRAACGGETRRQAEPISSSVMT